MLPNAELASVTLIPFPTMCLPQPRTFAGCYCV